MLIGIEILSMKRPSMEVIGLIEEQGSVVCNVG